MEEEQDVRTECSQALREREKERENGREVGKRWGAQSDSKVKTL